MANLGAAAAANSVAAAAPEPELVPVPAAPEGPRCRVVSKETGEEGGRAAAAAAGPSLGGGEPFVLEVPNHLNKFDFEMK
ncbi:hypothetical protein AB5N19_03094 [Seiridium cardinale]